MRASCSDPSATSLRGAIGLNIDRLRTRAALAVLSVAAASVAGAAQDPNGAIPTGYSIDFHVFSSGGSALHNSCYRVTGTIGQAAPGYSSGSTDSIYAGFWAAAPVAGLDQLFFSGFEDC
jgi:hypothetical protein